MTDDIYISAKKLKAHYAWWGDTEERKTLDAIVDAQPAADVQEVKHGHWTHDGSQWKYRFICSECGFKLFDEKRNYCPNCGAKMDGKENEK